jgi:hypothetical protein
MTLRTAQSQYRIDVLDHLVHQDFCDWRTIGECGCDAGQMLITLIAEERREAAAPALDVEAPAKALAFIVIRDREAHERVERENRWTLPEPLWESLDEYQRNGWRSLAAEYARLSAQDGGA